MATKNKLSSDMTERCDSCQHETPHKVSVQIKTESTKTENAEFSREPYRVAECLSCGEVTNQRMNNA